MSSRVCDIARDLMPLAVDDAASASSRSFVEEHVAMCPECAKIYREMQSAQPAAAPDDSDRAFGRSMERMRKRRRRAVSLGIAALLALAVAITAAWPAFCRWAFYTPYAGIPFEQTRTRILQASTGEVGVFFSTMKSAVSFGMRVSDRDASGGTWHVKAMSGRFPYLLADRGIGATDISPDTATRLWVIDGRMYEISVQMQRDESGAFFWPEPIPVASIWYDGPGRALLYEAGDAIGLMSEEDLRVLRLEPGKRDAGLSVPYYAEAAAAILRGEPLPEPRAETRSDSAEATPATPGDAASPGA